MLPSELLEVFRDEMNDREMPYLWGDDEFYRHADDAQKMFCRKTDGIADDFTPAVVELAIEPGTDRIALHPSVKLIRSALRTDTGRPVAVRSPEEMPGLGWYFDGRPGTVRALITGGSVNAARVYPVSAETVTVRLNVFRLPITTVNDDDEPFEIDEHHHRHLLLWIKHLAYSKQDAEAFDKTKARDFKADFETYCFEVQAEQRRARHKTRIVAYGGI